MGLSSLSSIVKNNFVFSSSTIVLLQGTLPFRLLAAEYGAHVVYGEELVDHKVIKCVREENGM